MSPMTRRDLLAASLAATGSMALGHGVEGLAGKAGTPGQGDLAFASGLEVARAIRARKVSSVEVTRLALDRIDRYNPKLNAIVTLTADLALKRAREADAALARGEW